MIYFTVGSGEGEWISLAHSNSRTTKKEEKALKFADYDQALEALQVVSDYGFIWDQDGREVYKL